MPHPLLCVPSMGDNWIMIVARKNFHSIDCFMEIILGRSCKIPSSSIE